jgi:hypothetical protein
MNAELGDLPEEFWNTLDELGISPGDDPRSEAAFNAAIEIGLQINESGYLSDDWYDLYGDELQDLIEWLLENDIDPHAFFEAMYEM